MEKKSPYLSSWYQDAEKLYTILIFLGIGMYVPGLFIDAMDIDAAQYASMSMEMWQSGNYLQIYEQGRDYLDKPPLLFWLSSLFIGVFGNCVVAYKFPSLLFSLLAIYSIYRFALLYYPRSTALLSALILTWSQSMFIMNNDVRTDNLLMGSVCFACWMLAEIDQSKRPTWWPYFGVGLGIGLAMLSKGPLGLVIPAMGFGAYWLSRKDWTKIFAWKWVLTLLVIAICLFPMCVGLYMQYDTQPDKIIHGRQGVSGIRFYFWEQSFGRITGESVWKNQSGPLFFLHTYIWAFFPWVMFLIPAIWSRIKLLSQGETASFWVFILTFIALSMSRFKLPHYIYVTVPFAAVFCAKWIDEKFVQLRWTYIVSWVPWILCVLFPIVIGYIVFPENIAGLILRLGVPAILSLFVIRRIKIMKLKSIFLLCSAVIILNIELSLHFYPKLLKYQGGTTALKFYNQVSDDADQLYGTSRCPSSAHFEYGKIIQPYESDLSGENGYIYLLINKSSLDDVVSNERQYEIVKSFPDYPITRLNGKFLNHKTREQVLDSTYLIKLNN
jgi:4-amino-4-deoxy-L-arabinose transferase-like glycosyltransferase